MKKIKTAQAESTDSTLPTGGSIEVTGEDEICTVTTTLDLAGATYNRLAVHNASEAAIEMLKPVKLMSANEDLTLFVVAPAGAGDDVFGILLATLAPDQHGYALFVGVITAPVVISDTAHKYVAPGAGGTLKSADKGSARILYKAEDDTGEMLVTFLLASAGSGSGGGVTIGVMTQRPSGRGGPATYKTITINPDGSWTAVGADLPIIVPILN